MELFGKDLTREIALVAEIGVNHEGSLDKACELIEAAAHAKADAVKFQSYSPQYFVNASDGERLARVGAFGLSDDDHYRLRDCAAYHGIFMFSSAITQDKVDFLSALCPAIKIASGDIDFAPTIIAAAKTGLPVILSTGLATWDEIDAAVALFCKNAKRQHLILMQCTSGYPTPIDQAQVAVMQTMRERYDVLVGFSNHILGPYACYAAAALGACVIEVHVTDQSEGREFHDHALSFMPDQLAQLAQGIGEIVAARGVADKQRQPCELPNLPAIRKGVIASCDLPEGAWLSADDIAYARVTNGISANNAPTLYGKQLRSAIAKHHPIFPLDVLDD